MSTRRNVMVLAGLVGFVVATRQVPKVYDYLSSDFDFQPLDTPAGFRALKQSEISTVLDPFIGLDVAPDAPAAITDLDTALYYSRENADHVQLAYFSDFYCPYCRVLGQQIIEMAPSEPIDISWHETPILGPTSVLAARGAIAAAKQGAYQGYHMRLVRTPVQVTVPFLMQLAARLGLDVAQFTADISSIETDAALDRARGLADIFGFIGTPSLVVGRTVVQGKISRTNLSQLIAIEAADLRT